MTVIDLSTLTFTKQNDTVPESGIVQITNTGTAKTLNGDDSIIASADQTDPNQTGPITLINRGTIDTGNGDDTIDSEGGRYASGMLNYGPIYTGNGDDTISVVSGRGASSENYDIIDTGRGDDTLGFGGSSFRNYGSIYTNNGDDTLGFVGTNEGLYNEGVVSTGNGNDIITGSSPGYGINNFGTIDTGNGNDVVDTSTSNAGFGGTGTTLLGNGEDIFKGFMGAGYFDAGEDNDTLLLGASTSGGSPSGSVTYGVSSSANSDGFYTISQSNGIESTFFVKNFEFIGSFRDPAAAFSFSSAIGGTFTV